MKNKKAQTAIEYMLLLAVIVAIMITTVPWFFPLTQNATDIFYNRVGVGIMGDSPSCNTDPYNPGCPCSVGTPIPAWCP